MAPTTFTFAACRNLKRFIGQATATVAANEVALHYTADYLAKPESAHTWSSLAAGYKIHVDGIKSDEVRRTSAKLHVVSIYASFDRFMRALRREWFELSQIQWVKYDSDTPFEEIERNVPQNIRNHVSDDTIACIEHYRYVRNAITHPCDETERRASEHYEEKSAKLREVGNLYGMTEAPHPLAAIDFHDSKLLAQLCIDVSRQISGAFDPGDAALAKAVPEAFRSFTRGTLQRARNRLDSYLRTKYGLNAERSRNIVNIIFGPLA